uniref:Uncharacterized protein n=1 Tax=viral metagenome TaxID=1070528 RepID=A0A6M3LJ49_9ZZZZ
MANYSTELTLGELLSSTNEVIKRHSMGILKQLQKPQTLYCDKCKTNTPYYADVEINTGDIITVCGNCRKTLI